MAYFPNKFNPTGGGVSSINLENGLLGVFNGANLKSIVGTQTSWTTASVIPFGGGLPTSSMGYQDTATNVLNEMNSDSNGFHIRAGIISSQIGIDFGSGLINIFSDLGGGDIYTLPLTVPNPGDVMTSLDGYNTVWSTPSYLIGTLSVKVATTGALPAFTYTSLGGVGDFLTANANGTINPQDTVTLVNGDRILVKNETAGNIAYNGVYVVTDIGSVGTPFILTRATDADTSAQFNNMSVIPAAGTQAATPFGQVDVVTAVGTDPVQFVIQASNALVQSPLGTTVTANSIPIYTNVVGGSSLTLTKGTADFTFGVLQPGNLTIRDANGNILIGALGTAGYLNTATNAVMIGSGAGNATSGSGSVYLGNAAGINTSGNDIVAIGENAAGALTLGDNGVFIGYQVGSNAGNTAGKVGPSIFLGNNAGGTVADQSLNNITGSSILIGQNSSTGGFANSIAIGDGATNTAANQFIVKSANNLSFDYSINKLSIGGLDNMLINGVSFPTNLQIHSDTNAIIESHTFGSGLGSIYYAAKSRGTTSAPLIVAAGDSLGIFGAVGYSGNAGVDYLVGGYQEYKVSATETPSTTAMGTDWALYLSADGTQGGTKVLGVNQQGLQNYASNALALAGDLSAGDLYYTDTAGEWVVKMAH